jgi:uncharacterized protein YyaL (SSP411 family)
MTTKNKPNRLIAEKSPYLLQHAHNPVEWFPWSEEAFEIAKRDNKPIFLSIGYSTCHWCHVMERESFEDEEVAEVLNRDYISIKVDREERPDVDHLYMSVCQAMTGHGGWPLTVLMTPEKKPFFAGTYFPKHRRQGRYGLMDVLGQLAQRWKNNPDEMEEVGNRVVESMNQNLLANLPGSASEQMLAGAFQAYDEMFSDTYGGFGSAPKFPTSHNLSFLLRYYVKTGNARALEMVEKTLDAMYKGGMYDHIGFGFSRYSTDEKWLVPHFEKMLYDNALLAMTYIEAFQVTGKQKYADAAEQIFAYVLRDMTDAEGGFYSAEDADSEGEEGKFYVWTPEEVHEVLGEADGEFYCDLFDITEQGNFEGHNIPNLIQRDLEIAAKLQGISLDELLTRAESCRLKLFAHREGRIHPYKDDKILTSWNGLMIVAFAKGAKALGSKRYEEAARTAVEFIWTRLRREDRRLLARYRDGEAAILGYADDYAFLVWGLIELYEATADIVYLQRAAALNQDMLRLFWDYEKGGLFFYGHDGEALFARTKETYDGAMPSGNSAAALNLQKLARLTADAKLEQTAEVHIEALSGAASQYPTGHSLFLAALDFYYDGGTEIVIAGDPNHEDTQDMLKLARSEFVPNATIVLVPTGSVAVTQAEAVRQLLPLVSDKTSIGGRATAYVCHNFSCQSPVTELEELRELLKENESLT